MVVALRFARFASAGNERFLRGKETTPLKNRNEIFFYHPLDREMKNPVFFLSFLFFFSFTEDGGSVEVSSVVIAPRWVRAKMGNNGSSSREQQVVGSVCSNGTVDGANGHHGWSQSFPRELARHRSQPSAARKVLPEPPGQRLRATDNGSIIHNGGTISGRRPPTFASSRDLAKVKGVRK